MNGVCGSAFATTLLLAVRHACSRAGRALSQPADPHRGADAGGRRAGHSGAAHAAASGEGARPAGDRREPLRRQHHDRHRGGRQGAARRPYPADRADHLHGQRRAQQQAQFRPRTRLRADRRAGEEPAAVRRQRQGTGQVAEGVRRARQGESPASSTTAPPAPRRRRICCWRCGARRPASKCSTSRIAAARAAALAVASGEVQIVLLSPLGILPQVQAGLVRPLATGGRDRDPKMPDLPTAAEAGFPGLRGRAMARPARHRRDAEAYRRPAQRRGEQDPA